MPVPIVAPTPNSVSWNSPIVRLSSPPSPVVRPGLLRHHADGLAPQDLLLQGRHSLPVLLDRLATPMSRASRSAHVSRRTTSRAAPSPAKTTGMRRVPL